MHVALLAALLAVLAGCAAPGGPAAAAPSPRPFARPAKKELPSERDARVRAGSQEASRLIREAVPLVEEVRLAVETPGARDHDEREALRAKAAAATAKLSEAREIYRAIEIDSPDQAAIPWRLRSIVDIVAVLQGSLRKL